MEANKKSPIDVWIGTTRETQFALRILVVAKTTVYPLNDVGGISLDKCGFTIYEIPHYPFWFAFGGLWVIYNPLPKVSFTLYHRFGINQYKFIGA